jgi:4'-phosphopantetheinyl transferase
LSDGVVQVWWAERGAVRGWHRGLLDRSERQRVGALCRQADRDRFVVGCAVLRLVAGAHLRLAPEDVPVRRDCAGCGEPHGKTRVEGLELSVSHAGDRVAVAVSRGLRLGVDVEQVRPTLEADAISGHVLSATERTAYERMLPRERVPVLLTYWVGKEAVLKATGDGLVVPLEDLTLAGPAERPRLESWEGRPGAEDRITLHRLYARHGYVARLAVIGEPVRVAELEVPWTRVRPGVAGRR